MKWFGDNEGRNIMVKLQNLGTIAATIDHTKDEKLNYMDTKYLVQYRYRN